MSYHGIEVECVNQFKYLYIILDKYLSFVPNALLWWIRNFISKDLAKHLNQSLIGPHFAYCNWRYIHDGGSVTTSHYLQVGQNNALLAEINADQKYPTDRMHEQLEINWLDVAWQKSSCIEAFKVLNGLGPENLII